MAEQLLPVYKEVLNPDEADIVFGLVGWDRGRSEAISATVLALGLVAPIRETFANVFARNRLESGRHQSDGATSEFDALAYHAGLIEASLVQSLAGTPADHTQLSRAAKKAHHKVTIGVSESYYRFPDEHRPNATDNPFPTAVYTLLTHFHFQALGRGIQGFREKREDDLLLGFYNRTIAPTFNVVQPPETAEEVDKEAERLFDTLIYPDSQPEDTYPARLAVKALVQNSAVSYEVLTLLPPRLHDAYIEAFDASGNAISPTPATADKAYTELRDSKVMKSAKALLTEHRRQRNQQRPVAPAIHDELAKNHGVEFVTP